MHQMMATDKAIPTTFQRMVSRWTNVLRVKLSKTLRNWQANLAILAILMLLLSGGCLASRPSPEFLSKSCPPTSSRESFVGFYANSPSEAAKSRSSDSLEQSLYHLLTLQRSTKLQSRYVPKDYATSIRHVSDDIYCITLSNAENETIESRQVELTYRDGYLHSRREWWFLMWVIANAWGNDVFALGIDKNGDLRTFHTRLVEAYILLFPAGGTNTNDNPVSKTYRRIEHSNTPRGQTVNRG